MGEPPPIAAYTLHFGCAPAGNIGTQPFLKRKLDDFAIGEQLEQKWLYVVQGGGSAQVEHNDPGLGLRPRSPFLKAGRRVGLDVGHAANITKQISPSLSRRSTQIGSVRQRFGAGAFA